MRLHIPILFMFILLCLMVTFTNTVLADEAIINTDNLNIRIGPGTEFDRIGEANTDEIYPILQQQGNWVEIQLENSTGWITTEYITIKSESAEFPTKKSITIQYDNTQIRNGPSTDYDIIYFAEKSSRYDVISEIGDWYEVSQDNFSGYVLKQLVEKEEITSSRGFKNKTIVIDAGHGGRDVGAIGATGVFEKDIAYLTAHELAQELTVLGAEVLLTRPEDEFVSLGSRISFTNMMDTDIFISIHYNSVPELPEVTGIETYYYQEQNKQLASYIQSEIIKETEANDRGTTHANFLVIKQNLKPSILIELGFISNKEKESLLGTNAYQKKLVTGIVNGLGKYFANE